jgi:hypothetical protein
MHSALKDVTVTGIIKPGDVYIFHTDSENTAQIDQLNYMYVIMRDEQILPALEMETCLVIAEDYELKQFLGIHKISRDCYEFKILAYNKPERQDEERCYYLHGVQSFEEKLRMEQQLAGIL